MTDIVERLRSRIRWDTCVPAEMVMEYAAQEIESLRQQLEAMTSYAIALEAKASGYTGLKEELAECQAQNTKLSERIRSLEESLANSVNADWHNEAIKQANREALLEAAEYYYERGGDNLNDFSVSEELRNRAKELE